LAEYYDQEETIMIEAQKLNVARIIGVGIAVLSIVAIEAFCGSPQAMAAESPTTIFILQHAERHEFTQTDKDPDLTAEGKERAKELAHVLSDAGIAAVFTPKAKRMEQTVQPLQQSLKLPELNYYDEPGVEKMIQLINDKYKGKAVLIVGAGAHMGSGGIHDIIKKLGCSGPDCDSKDSYDNLFVITLYEPGKAAALQLHYGRPVRR
jgi:hypothetical protein